jgi:hypothetical protein
MSNYGTSYTIRSFDDWGAVYRHDEKVFESDPVACKDYVLAQTGVTVENEDAFIAENGQAAPTLLAARKAQEARG